MRINCTSVANKRVIHMRVFTIGSQIPTPNVRTNGGYVALLGTQQACALNTSHSSVAEAPFTQSLKTARLARRPHLFPSWEEVRGQLGRHRTESEWLELRRSLQAQYGGAQRRWRREDFGRACKWDNKPLRGFGFLNNCKKIDCQYRPLLSLF